MMIKLKEFRSYNEKKLGVDITFENKDGFDELGDVKIEHEKVFDSIEVGKLLGLFLNEELAKSIVVSVDVEKTEKNLKERYGFTDVAIAPLIKILKEHLTVNKERLVVK